MILLYREERQYDAVKQQTTIYEIVCGRVSGKRVYDKRGKLIEEWQL